MKYILCFLLCLCFIPKEVSALVKENTPQIVQISPEAMKELEAIPGVESKKVVMTDEEKKDPEQTAVKHSSGGSNIGSAISGMDGRGAIVVIAIIGVVLVIVWLAALPTMVYQAIKHKKQFNYQHMLSLSYLSINTKQTDQGDASDEERKGNLYGLKYSFFMFQDKHKKLMGGLAGAQAEIGRYNLISNSTGHYWSVGPSLAWFFKSTHNPFMLKLDLGVGSAFDPGLGLFSKSDLFFNYLFNSELSLGLGISGMYFHAKENDARIRSTENVGFGFGLNTSYLF